MARQAPQTLARNMLTTDHHLGHFDPTAPPAVDGRRFISTAHAKSWRELIMHLREEITLPHVFMRKVMAMVGLHEKQSPFAPMAYQERHLSVEYFHSFLQGMAMYLTQELRADRDQWTAKRVTPPLSVLSEVVSVSESAEAIIQHLWRSITACTL